MSEEEVKGTEVTKEQHAPKNIEHDKPFWKRHFLKLLLLLLLVVSFAWGYFGKKQAIAEYETKITHLKETQQSEIRNLKAEQIKHLSNTLALAIRSEMIAENMNQVDQYFLQTVKMFDVERILLVNQETSEVILSTNKKDEGTTFESNSLVSASKSIQKMYNSKLYTATPIMGLNTQLAVLIIQVD